MTASAHTHRTTTRTSSHGLTRQGRSQQLIGQQLQVFQGDVPDGRNVEQASKGVWILGGEDVEQGHTTVQPSQGTLTAQ